MMLLALLTLLLMSLWLSVDVEAANNYVSIEVIVVDIAVGTVAFVKFALV